MEMKVTIVVWSLKTTISVSNAWEQITSTILYIASISNISGNLMYYTIMNFWQFVRIWNATFHVKEKNSIDLLDWLAAEVCNIPSTILRSSCLLAASSVSICSSLLLLLTFLLSTPFKSHFLFLLLAATPFVTSVPTLAVFFSSAISSCIPK